MARVIVTIDTENDAFHRGQGQSEAAKILMDAAHAVEDGFTSGHCIDSNGNIVGKWSASFPKD